MQHSFMSSAWTPPPSLRWVATIITATLATLAALAAFGWLPVPVAIGAALVFGVIGGDCYRRGER